MALSSCAFAQVTNTTTAPLLAPSLPEAGLSLFRVVGALALVLGLFLGGVWLYRNWQRLALQRGRAPKLNVVETRSLGGRHALYVVGYEQERFLLAASPNGVSLLTHLPTAEAAMDAEAAPITTSAPAPSFAATLAQVLKAK
jgi:flagellar biogenesis protein FliO